LLIGCIPDDNIEMPELLLKDDVESKISEKFAIDFMIYSINAVKIRNQYINDREKFLSEESQEEKINLLIADKWASKDLNKKEKEILNKLLKFEINEVGIKYDYSLYLKGKMTYEQFEDDLKTVIEKNDDILKDLFNYFESK
jgi:hypothetical protein